MDGLTGRGDERGRRRTRGNEDLDVQRKREREETGDGMKLDLRGSDRKLDGGTVQVHYDSSRAN